MLHICKNKIKEEVKMAEYLAVMCDETTDIYDKTQMVIVLRYELQGKPVERFWGFFNVISQTAEALSSVLLGELKVLIDNSPHKLIAQTYDGAAALSGVNKGVQTKIKEVYPNAHFIHCHAHQLNLILEHSTSQNSKVRIFFNSLSGIPSFFSKSPQRMAAFENIAGHRIPRPSATRWNFKSRTVNAVHEMKDELVECCSILEASSSRDTGYRPFPETRAIARARANLAQINLRGLFSARAVFQTNVLIKSCSLASQFLNYLPLKIRVLVNNVYALIKWRYKYSNIKTNQQFCKG